MVTAVQQQKNLYIQNDTFIGEGTFPSTARFKKVKKTKIELQGFV